MLKSLTSKVGATCKAAALFARTVTKFTVLAFALFVVEWDQAEAGSGTADSDRALNLDYVACMIAVNDADKYFIGELQITCEWYTRKNCFNVHFAATPDESTACLWSEVQEAASFVVASATMLPERIDGSSVTARFYPSRRSRVIEWARDALSSQPPGSVEEAAAAMKEAGHQTSLLFRLAQHSSFDIQTVGREQ